MKVTLWAHTTITDGLRGQLAQQDDATDADTLAEAAGRSCFQSWSRPRPETAATGDYLANIIRQHHLSVLSHGSATFYIEGISRPCAQQLIRSRWISISELSQRYCDVSDTEPVMPPAVIGDVDVEGVITRVHNASVAAYGEIVDMLEAAGLPRKRAREAARAVMPNATPTAMVLSSNFRGWRDLISQRIADGADREIQAVATELLRQLRPLAPGTFSDFPEVSA